MYGVLASRVLGRLRGLISNAMVFVALFYFVYAPTLDSMAKEDALESSPNFIERVIAAFDVVDDVLDQIHPQKPAVEQHQMVSPILPELPVQVAVRIDLPVEWTWALPLPPPGASPAVPSPPPRA